MRDDQDLGFDFDPYAILGLRADAGGDQVARAYRELAKEHHPDIAGDEGVERMRQINAAYEAVLSGRARPRRDDGPAVGEERDPEAAERTRRRGAAWWLEDRTRRALGHELVVTLEEREPVILTADASSWDAHDIRLVLTDRRLLWLRDDAVGDRVRWERFRVIDSVRVRERRRLRRTAELHVTAMTGRRHNFAEMNPALAGTFARELRARVPELARRERSA